MVDSLSYSAEQTDLDMMDVALLENTAGHFGLFECNSRQSESVKKHRLLTGIRGSSTLPTSGATPPKAQTSDNLLVIVKSIRVYQLCADPAL